MAIIYAQVKEIFNLMLIPASEYQEEGQEADPAPHRDYSKEVKEAFRDLGTENDANFEMFWKGILTDKEPDNVAAFLNPSYGQTPFIHYILAHMEKVFNWRTERRQLFRLFLASELTQLALRDPQNTTALRFATTLISELKHSVVDGHNQEMKIHTHYLAYMTALARLQVAALTSSFSSSQEDITALIIAMTPQNCALLNKTHLSELASAQQEAPDLGLVVQGYVSRDMKEAPDELRYQKDMALLMMFELRMAKCLNETSAKAVLTVFPKYDDNRFSAVGSAKKMFSYFTKDESSKATTIMNQILATLPREESALPLTVASLQQPVTVRRLSTAASQH